MFWCIGYFFILIDLGGGEDKCALQYLLHLHTYKRLLFGGEDCFGF